MSAVKVEIAEEIPRSSKADAEIPLEDGPPPGPGARKERSTQQDRRGAPTEAIEIEREYTKRELYKSISAIVVVVLYMIFTLLRDRESGVVVVEPEEGDWDES
jgi:hypothetical protein